MVADNERHGTEYSIAFMDTKTRCGAYHLEIKCNFNGEQTMDKRRLATVVIVIGIAAILAASLPLTKAKANHCHPSHKQTPKTDMKEPVRTRALNLERQRARTRVSSLEKKPVMVETLSLDMIHSRELPIAILSIDKAAKAVESGDNKTALTELNKALNTLIAIYGALGTHVKPQFANNRCPIMGSPINPEKVATNLIRDYKGQKVAFCCAGCPSMWDKLTDAQKQTKLAKVKPTLQKVWTCSMHPQIKLPKPGSCPLCKMKLIAVSTQ